MPTLIRSLVAVICAASLLSACTSTVGRKFDSSYVQSIERGKTTKADVRSHIGEPGQTMNSGDPQEETWVYQYTDVGGYFARAVQPFTPTKTVSSSTESLSITFRGDVVKDYAYTATRQK